MTQVCFDRETGAVLFTVDGSEVPPGLGGDWIEADAARLGDLTAWRVIDGALQLVDLAPARRVAIAAVNDACGAIRMRFITNIPGQETIYRWKEAEAIRYLALEAEPADLADFPMLAREIGITAPSAYQLAQIWAFMSASLADLSGQLESARIGTVARIEAAQSRDEIASAEQDFAAAIGKISPL